ncbi:MAG: hypothetical protein ACHP9Y_00140 [Gammaproteobacteria bacterium]
MDTKLMADIAFCTLALIFFISGAVCFYFYYYYLWKFEKKHGIKIKGRGIFLIDRIICTGILGRLAMRGPNKPIPPEYLEHKYAIHYIKLPYEDIKSFKIFCYVSLIGVISALLAVLVIKLFLE